jgi:DNA-binding protein HU-beta
MNKADLLRTIAEETGLTSKSCDAMLKSFTDTVMKAVAKGDQVSLIGFGNFQGLKREARIGRNPATGGKINIPAKTVPKFSPGKKFRDLLV